MTAFTFVETDEFYSTYRDPDGELVYLAHGVGLRRLTPFHDIDLTESWNAFIRDLGWPDQGGWLELLRNTTTDPDLVDGILWCPDCALPMDEEEGGHTTVASGEDVCESCISAYSCCEDCEEYHSSGSVRTLDDENICGSCRDRNYTWCEHCDGWYRDRDADDHEHGTGSDCCESPAQTFTVRNDGEEPLGNDHRVTVALAAGVISPEGIKAISNHLWRTGCLMYEAVVHDSYEARAVALDTRNNYLQLAQEDNLLGHVGATWQTRKGNFTKRLSSYAHKTFGIRLTPEVLSHIGCIARDHSTAVDFHVEVTRDLNLGPADFGHEESCWWDGFDQGRCALKSNGGFGIRTFQDFDGDSSARNVTGRAWVMPLKLVQMDDPSPAQYRDGLQPTFNTHPDAFVVFNGYGTLCGYAPARLLAHMAGMTYRKIRFSCTPMYVNSGSGYLVAPEEIAAPYTDGELRLTVDPHSHLFHTETEGALSNVA